MESDVLVQKPNVEIVKETKFLVFAKAIENNHTFYLVGNKASQILGYIDFYTKWCRYVFHSSIDGSFIYDVTCLDDISNFMKELKAD